MIVIDLIILILLLPIGYFWYELIKKGRKEPKNQADFILRVGSFFLFWLIFYAVSINFIFPEFYGKIIGNERTYKVIVENDFGVHNKISFLVQDKWDDWVPADPVSLINGNYINIIPPQTTDTLDLVLKKNTDRIFLTTGVNNSAFNTGKLYPVSNDALKVYLSEIEENNNIPEVNFIPVYSLYFIFFIALISIIFHILTIIKPLYRYLVYPVLILNLAIIGFTIFKTIFLLLTY